MLYLFLAILLSRIFEYLMIQFSENSKYYWIFLKKSTIQVMPKIIKIIVFLIGITLSNSLYCEPYNCYQLLQISNSATVQQIKKAFRAMAKRHHPDRNKLQDTTQLFQKINIAYQILQNQHTRKAYDLFMQDPSGSRAYHTYQYYRASYSPQLNPFFVIFSLLVLLSWLQWVMRKQMYASAIDNIVNSQNFRKRVNQQCENAGKKGNKIFKEQVAQRLEQQISIQGGYSKPQIKDMLICRVFLLPYSIVMGLKSMFRWIWKYYIKREQYDQNDKNQLTRKALKVPVAQWESFTDDIKKSYTQRKLWIRENMRKYQQQMQQKQLELLKQTNPAKYRKIMNYLKKQQ